MSGMLALGDSALRTCRSLALATGRLFGSGAARRHHGMVDLRTPYRGLLLRPHRRRLTCRSNRLDRREPD